MAKITGTKDFKFKNSQIVASYHRTNEPEQYPSEVLIIAPEVTLPELNDVSKKQNTYILTCFFNSQNLKCKIIDLAIGSILGADVITV
jgi:hypothetical protein